MMNKTIISLTGLPGSGKDTIARLLIDRGGWGKVSFAAPLKRGLAIMLNIPMEHIDDPQLKNSPNYKFGKSIRYMLQTLGTEWGRSLIDDEIWIRLAQEAIDEQFELGNNVVITDMRFENEAQYLTTLPNTHLIEIIRRDTSLTESAAKHGIRHHASDAGIPRHLIDHTLFNDTTLSDFNAKSLSLIDKVMNA